MTRSDLAFQLRISLLEVIAPDRRCAHCRRFLALEDAAIDHVDGRTWACRRLNFLDRIRRQWREWMDGVPLHAACKSYNSREGNKLRGKRRYAVAYK